MRKTSHTEFIELLRDKKPDLELISNFNGYINKILVKDKNGIIYNICPRSLIQNKTISIETAIDKTSAYNLRLKELFPDLSFTEVEKGNIKTIVVDSKGIQYYLKPESLLIGHYPTLQSAIDKNKAFEILAREVHGDIYDYSKSIYTKDKEKLDIICPVHGIFSQRPNNHINQKQGCPECNQGRGWKLEEWLKFTKGRVCIFYKIQCFNNDEKFIKIGITSTSLEKRFINNKCMPYFYNILEIYKGDSLSVWEKEKDFQIKNKKYLYKPSIKFHGWTECYLLNK